MSLWRSRQGALQFAAEALWRMPNNFGIARLFGPSYTLRSVVFHNITAQSSPFTRGMWVDTSPEEFESKLRFLAEHYTPVSLKDVIAAGDGRAMPPRAVLVTFDDAYASVAEIAAPLCAKYNVPAVFFVNSAFLDNQELAPDNLVCYVANELGMAPLNAAAREVLGARQPVLGCMSEVFSNLFPVLSLDRRREFLDALARVAKVAPAQLAADAKLYITSEQLAGLTSFDFEIGNHTHTHVHCRCLRGSEFVRELGVNKNELEAASGQPVRSFSLPYGSSADLTPQLEQHLRDAGYAAVFFSESVANGRHADLFHLDRVSTHAAGDEAFFLEMEVLPRLRVVRNFFVRPIGPAATEA